MPVFTLFGQSGGGSLAGDSSTGTLGMQFRLSQAATLTGIWFFSPSGATALPVACCIYQVTGAGTGTQVPGSVNTSPSWSGATGSGWVKVPYASGPVLAAGTSYKACILKDATLNVYSVTSHYWDTGAGSGGLTSGIITAPNSAGGDGGQDTFTEPSAVLSYPASVFNASNYWIDPEVTTLAVSGGISPAPDDKTHLKKLFCLLG